LYFSSALFPRREFWNTIRKEYGLSEEMGANAYDDEDARGRNTSGERQNTNTFCLRSFVVLLPVTDS
jgi:hypothetical protein